MIEILNTAKKILVFWGIYSYESKCRLIGKGAGNFFIDNLGTSDVCFQKSIHIQYIFMANKRGEIVVMLVGMIICIRFKHMYRDIINLLMVISRWRRGN